MDTPKLYMMLLGCSPVNRNVEQHDVFFSIACRLNDLVPEIIEFWPEANKKIHLDAWREVTRVGAYNIEIELKQTDTKMANKETPKLFFINLGGYKPGEFEEYHYRMLVACNSKGGAVDEAKKTTFYKHTGFAGATSHVDDKFGIDVDDLYQVEDILSLSVKEKYAIVLTPATSRTEDEIHLGYFKLDKI